MNGGAGAPGRALLIVKREEGTKDWLRAHLLFSYLPVTLASIARSEPTHMREMAPAASVPPGR